MSRIIMLAFAAIAAVIVVVAVVAGGDDELSAAETRLSAAIANDLVSAEPGQPPSLFTAVEAVCVADEIVRGVGMVSLNELGLDRQRVDREGFNPQAIRFDEQQRGVVLDAFDGCVDLLDAAVQTVAPDAGEATRACLVAAFGEDGARALWRWRMGPVDVAMPDGLATRLELADACLIG